MVVSSVVLPEQRSLLAEQVLFKLLDELAVFFGILLRAFKSLVDLYRLTSDEVEAMLPDDILEKIGELLLVFFDPPLHAGVPVIFNGVVCTAFKEVGDISPLIGLISIQEVEDPFFFSSPSSASLNPGIEMVVPSLSALLSDSSWQVIGYLGPFLWSFEVD